MASDETGSGSERRWRVTEPKPKTGLEATR
jgi:hypothetical protein